MKSVIRRLLNLSFATLLASTSILAMVPAGRAYAATTTYDFNATNVVDLKATSFNEGVDGTAFTYGTGQGLSSSDAIEVNNKTGIWTAKTGLSYPADNSYEVSGYFANSQNNGRGGLGISPIDNSTNSAGYPFAPTGLGVVFHGGGGDIYNNGSAIGSLNWTGGDIADNAWSYMHLSVAPLGSNQFDLHFEIYPSDANGVLGTLKTEHTIRGITNTNLGAVTTAYGYFGTSDQRFAYVDNFAFGVELNSIPPAPIYFPGSGTSEDPYRISTCHQLQDIGVLDSTQGKYFVLQNDINCGDPTDDNDSSVWDSGDGFLPIGYSTDAFKGDFDGSGFAINNLTINRGGDTNVGLFSSLAGANVRNFTISGNITGESNTGAVAGYVRYNDDNEPSVVSAISSSATISANDYNTGGIIGYSDGYDNDFNVITDCTSTGSVSGYASVGGIVGNASYTDITNNYSSGDVYADYSDAGGLIGDAALSNISQNGATSNVHVSDQEGGGMNAGGLIGGTWQATVLDNFARGNVTADYRRAGGLIGLIVNTDISNSYSSGEVSSASESGGFIGIFQYAADTGHSTIENSFSTGSVTETDGPSDTIHGFVGNLEPNTWQASDFVNNFFNRDNNNECAVVNSIAAVEYEECLGEFLSEQPSRFQTISESPYTLESLPLWDFDTTWKIQDGDYPCLQSINASCNTTIPHDADFVTSAQDGSVISIEETGCSSIHSFTSQKESELDAKDAGYDYIAGLINFELRGCTVGGTATVSLNFMGTYDPAKVLVRKYNANTKAFSTLSGVYEDMSVSATTVEGQPAYRVTYNINDGSSLDQDGVANGRIVDPIGVAASIVAVPNTGLARR